MRSVPAGAPIVAGAGAGHQGSQARARVRLAPARARAESALPPARERRVWYAAPPMRRLARHLFTFCSAASLVLLVAVCVLWARSYWRGDAVSWGTPAGRAGVESVRGRLIVGRLAVPPAALANIPRGRVITSAPADEAAAAVLEPGWSFATVQTSRVRTPGMTAEDVRIPYWLLAVATGVLPAWWLRRRARARRVRLLGPCPSCGYVLRASPQRCPECGAAATARARTGARA